MKEIEANQILKVIRYKEQDIAHYEQEKEYSCQFYDDKITANREEIDRLSDTLFEFVQDSGRKSIDLPNGILKTRRTTKKIYPPTEELVDWAREHNVPVRMQVQIDKADREISKLISETTKDLNCKIMYNVYKNDIAEKIKSTGEIPEGYEEMEEISFNYKLKRGHNG